MLFHTAIKSAYSHACLFLFVYFSFVIAMFPLAFMSLLLSAVFPAWGICLHAAVCNVVSMHTPISISSSLLRDLWSSHLYVPIYFFSSCLFCLLLLSMFTLQLFGSHLMIKQYLCIWEEKSFLKRFNPTATFPIPYVYYLLKKEKKVILRSQLFFLWNIYN